MSHSKPFTLYTHKGGPNGWKVAFVLGELGFDYKPVYLDIGKGEHKSPEFIKYNPNGRIPALIDHKNSDFIVWESNAILVYLVEKYDKDRKISVSDPNEKALLLQWLFFQASGQGPYFGQATWFKLFHPEKIPSAIERYQKETYRVLGVLESVLSKQEWLVGDKYTIADISFITWNDNAISFILADYNDFNIEKDFPSVNAWHQKLISREPVKKAREEREALRQEK